MSNPLRPSIRTLRTLLRESARASRDRVLPPTSRFHSYRYRSVPELVAIEGKAGLRTPFSETEWTKLQSVLRGFRPQPKCCFANAQRLASRGVALGLQYVEGYALSPGLPEPIYHAWCVWRRRPIDVTWVDLSAPAPRGRQSSDERLRERIAWNMQHSPYLGIVIPDAYLIQHTAYCLEAYSAFNAVLDHWQVGWPVLAHGVRVMTTP